jgi:uncharacterized protein YcbX
MITELYKYPVKGLTGQKLDTLPLVAHEGIEGDRAIAIARTPHVFDPAAPKAEPKTKFLMLAKDEALANLETRYDTVSKELVIEKGNKIVLSASIESSDGKQAIADFFYNYLNKDDIEPRVVHAPEHKFTDISVVSREKMRAISMINLASVRALEEAVGVPLDIRRFRANIYFDTCTPWEELEWLDREITIGSVVAKCVMLTKRCPATEVNPDTGERDIRLPLELRKHFGHVNMGIYAEVQTSGNIGVGDKVIAA